MALNGLNCAYVPLRNYSLTHPLLHFGFPFFHFLFSRFPFFRFPSIRIPLRLGARRRRPPALLLSSHLRPYSVLSSHGRTHGLWSTTQSCCRMLFFFGVVIVVPVHFLSVDLLLPLSLLVLGPLLLMAFYPLSWVVYTTGARSVDRDTYTRAPLKSPTCHLAMMSPWAPSPEVGSYPDSDNPWQCESPHSQTTSQPKGYRSGVASYYPYYG